MRATSDRSRVRRVHVPGAAGHAADPGAHVPRLRHHAGGALHARQPLPQLAARRRRGAVHTRAAQHAGARRRVHAHRDVRRSVRGVCARRRPPRPHKPVPRQLELGARSDVQRRVSIREPPSRRSVQAPPERRMRYIHQPSKETEADPTEDGHRHGSLHGHVKTHESISRP